MGDFPRFRKTLLPPLFQTMKGVCCLTGNLTAYKDVNELLQAYEQGIRPILGGDLRGAYLTGSLSYEAFDYGRSDIDIVVIVQRPLSPTRVEAAGRFHVELEKRFTAWARRIECSYTPVEMLTQVRPPREPRPYWGAGVLYEAAQYGNEWVINNYLLYRHGIVLYGPEFRELCGPVDIEEVQKACVRDLFQEWEPKAGDAVWFRDSHYSSYFILNLCRILYTVIRKELVSKQAAAAWVQSRYGEPWRSLIEKAARWHYGMELDIREQAIAFLDLVVQEVSGTRLYELMGDEIRELRSRTS